MSDLYIKTKKLMHSMKKKTNGALQFLIINDFGNTSLSTPEMGNSIFRSYTMVVPEEGRKLNPLFDPTFDIYRDTLTESPTIIQYKLGKIKYDSWQNYNRVLSLNIPRCQINCWHCFVDECLRIDCRDCNIKEECTFLHTRKNCKEGWFTAAEIISKFIVQRDLDKERGINSNVLRLTGGEPFLLPDLHVALLEELKNQNLHHDVFLWTETNLIPFIPEKDGIQLINDDYLDILGEFNNYAIHTCFHGLNEDNFKENTGNEIQSIDSLIAGVERLLNYKIDIYPSFGSNVTPETIVEEFYYKISNIHKLLPLKFTLAEFDLNWETISWRRSYLKDYKEIHEKIYDKIQVISKWDELLYNNLGYHYTDIPSFLVPIV